MPAHSFDRFYVDTKFILPTISNLKFSTINFDETCYYVKEENGCDHNSKEYISDLRINCNKIVPFRHFYRKQISSYNCTAHNILMNEITLILPNFPKARQERRSVIALLISGFIGLAYEGISHFLNNRRHKALHKVVKALLISGFIGLAYEGISHFLHNRRHKALHKVVKAMENKVNLQCNKLMHIEDSIVMYGIYNTET